MIIPPAHQQLPRTEKCVTNNIITNIGTTKGNIQRTQIME